MLTELDKFDNIALSIIINHVNKNALSHIDKMHLLNNMWITDARRLQPYNNIVFDINLDIFFIRHLKKWGGGWARHRAIF